jgi:cytochrome P450
MIQSFIARTAETVFLVAAAWPAIQSGVNPSFWSTFPALARRLFMFVVAYLALATTILLWAPPWLQITTTIAAGLWLVALWWHERISHGRARDWPPGSLRLLPLDAWFNRGFFFEQSRQLGSPFKTSHFFRPMACFVGLSDGLNFLKEHESTLASPSLPFGRFIPGGFIRHMSEERHALTKQLFRKALAREVYEPLDPFVRETIRAELNRTVARSELATSSVVPRPHIQRMTFLIWVRMFFNISDADRLAQLKQLYKVIDIRNPTGASHGSINSALDEIAAIARRQLRDDEASRSALARSFFEAIAMADPGAVDNGTIVRNLIYLLHTSWADVSGLLVWLWRMMTEHPTWADRMREAAPSTDMDATPLSTRIVMETLRLEQSEQLYRVTTRQIEHAHFVIPKGWLVRLCVRESHQDPTVFEHPEQFDPNRFLGHTFNRREYSAFGGALRHACLGEGLTTLVGRCFVEELTGHFSWRTIDDGECEYGPWRHWRPSSRWRVAVSVRSGNRLPLSALDPPPASTSSRSSRVSPPPL